jgi:hypothetical protein
MQIAGKKSDLDPTLTSVAKIAGAELGIKIFGKLLVKTAAKKKAISAQTPIALC